MKSSTSRREMSTRQETPSEKSLGIPDRRAESGRWGLLRRSVRKPLDDGIATGDIGAPGAPRPISIRRISEVALNKVRSGMAATAGALSMKKSSSMYKSRRATSKDEHQLAQADRAGDVRTSSARLASSSHSPELTPVNVQCGGASCRGKSKVRNEDRLTVLAHLVQDEASTKSSVGFAAVFDGHGGERCVEHISVKLPTLLGHEIFQVMRELDTDHWETVTRLAMARGIAAMDEEVLQLAIPRHDVSGACGVMVTVRGCEVTLANVGDCRAMIFPRLDSMQVRRLTQDHCTKNPKEVERIELAGGRIIDGRVNGVLAPTRAFGDADLKQTPSGLVAYPDVSYFHAEPGDVLILCSDGVTGAFSDEEIAMIVSNDFDGYGNDPSHAAATLCKRAAEKEMDDSSAVIIVFDAVKSSSNLLADDDANEPVF